MFKQIAAAAMLAVTGLGLGAGSSFAGERVVVIELYTSQGCSSCPPADALMHELADRDDLIPLALHVDYWDYIGWKDIFANPAHADRQRAYAHAAGQRTIYTPQMIVGGRDHVVGHKPMRLGELIQEHQAESEVAEITMTRAGGMVSVTITAMQPVGNAVVQLVRYMPQSTVEIKRGENKGRTISYANIVTEWNTLDPWDGQSDYSTQAKADGDQPVVVVVQAPNNGPILAAARLR